MLFCSAASNIRSPLQFLPVRKIWWTTCKWESLKGKKWARPKPLSEALHTLPCQKETSVGKVICPRQNQKCWVNSGWIMGQRLRRWPIIKPELTQRLELVPGENSDDRKEGPVTGWSRVKEQWLMSGRRSGSVPKPFAGYHSLFHTVALGPPQLQQVAHCRNTSYCCRDTS